MLCNSGQITDQIRLVNLFTFLSLSLEKDNLCKHCIQLLWKHIFSCNASPSSVKSSNIIRIIADMATARPDRQIQLENKTEQNKTQ